MKRPALISGQAFFYARPIPLRYGACSGELLEQAIDRLDAVVQNLAQFLGMLFVTAHGSEERRTYYLNTNS
jgi:hypothetical protein